MTLSYETVGAIAAIVFVVVFLTVAIRGGERIMAVIVDTGNPRWFVPTPHPWNMIGCRHRSENNKKWPRDGA
jgi:hypothetical protein